MSEYGFYLERARTTQAMLATMESAARRRPSDLALRINVASARKIADRAEQELEAVVIGEQIDLCRYRLIAPENGLFSVRGVSHSLGAFQDVFTFVYDALTDAPKQIARLARARHDETSLEFGYTFEGSLGVVLMAPRHLSLFGAGKFDDSIDAINAIFDISDEDELRDVAKRIGRAAVQKVFEWSNINFGEGFSVDLKWLSPSTIQKGRYLEWKQFERIAGLIGRTSDSEVRTITSRGVLVGFSSVAKTFHFVEPEGEAYRGQLSETFPVTREWTINRSYTAEIELEQKTNLATGDDIIRYRLRHLREMPDA
jgi:hypothetical protein